MKNLVYDLTYIDLKLQELVEVAESGDLTQEEVSQVVEGMQGEITQVVENVASVLVNYCSMVDALDTEIERLKARKQRITKLIKLLQNALQVHMELTGECRVETAKFRVSVVKNGGKLPIEVTGDVYDFPEEYCTFTPKPNLEAIRKALENGVTLEFAHFGERGKHLRIV
jgi:hypothetical protein